MSIKSDSIRDNLNLILSRIVLAQKRSPRNQKVTIVAVSKKQSIDKINAYSSLIHQAGEVPIFGENYLQEFADKEEAVIKPFDVHFIGHLQSNKVKDAVKLFTAIESVHDLRLLQKIDTAAGSIGKVMPVFLQVNISKDPNKSGFLASDVKAAFDLGATLKNIKIVGLMTITELYDSAEAARDDFRAMRRLGDAIFGERAPYCLSMGMSQDYEVAIEEGATHIRIGTGLFGARE
jgi:hypothetical protein